MYIYIFFNFFLFFLFFITRVNPIYIGKFPPPVDFKCTWGARRRCWARVVRGSGKLLLVVTQA